MCGTVQDNDGEYCPLTTIDMITKSAEQLRESVQEQKERRKRSTQAVAAKDAREDRPIMLPPQNVHVLEGHNNEVFICAWSPKENLLASGYHLCPSAKFCPLSWSKWLHASALSFQT